MARPRKNPIEIPGAENATTATAAEISSTPAPAEAIQPTASETPAAPEPAFFDVASAMAAEIIEHFQGYEFTDGESHQPDAILNRKQPYLSITARRELAAPAANPTTNRAPTAVAPAMTR